LRSSNTPIILGSSSDINEVSNEEIKEDLASRIETLESSLEYIRRQTGLSIPVTSTLITKFEKTRNETNANKTKSIMTYIGFNHG
jgi:ribosomal 50S subunit-associated protein YjgA (DUF615 family)